MSPQARRSAVGCALLLAARAAMAQATSFDLVPDVPTDLGGATRLPWEIVEHDAATGSYSAVLTLPEDTPVSALHGLDTGDALFSVGAPRNLGGSFYEARDVIRFDGTSYSRFLDGAANGLPPDVHVDALFLLGGDGGDAVLSFDAPTTIGPTTYLASDLVRFSAGVASLYFDSTAAGVPPGSNVSGASQSVRGVALTFDAPTDLGATTYLPGQLVEWDGSSFRLLYADLTWPISSRVNGFSLREGDVRIPGEVPPTLTVGKVDATTVHLSWTSGCGAGAADYGIYEGQVGNWTSHAMVDCIDDGADLGEDVTPAAGSRYFLVVPHDALSVEGSYGTDHDGVERPAGTATCQATRSLGQCS